MARHEETVDKEVSEVQVICYNNQEMYQTMGKLIADVQKTFTYSEAEAKSWVIQAIESYDDGLFRSPQRNPLKGDF